jgi:branched-chain amino acid transport system substrate-binding protein
MKHGISVATHVVLAVCLAFFLFVFVGSPASAAEPIRIGVVGSVTGWAGFIGTPQKEALTALVDDVNRKGGIKGRQVQLFFEDDTSNPTNAVIAATKLVKDKKVVALLGPSTTDSGMAMMPAAEQEQVPYVCTGPVVSPFRKWVFFVGPGDVRGASLTLEYAAKTLGAKRIALLRDTSNFGLTGSKVINKELSGYPGVSIVIEEKFETSDTTMVPQLTKIKAATPDLLILYTTGSPASIIAKNYKQLGMTMKVFGSGGVGTPEFMKNAGTIAEESNWVVFSTKFAVADKLPPDSPFRRDVYDPFQKLLREKYGESKTVSIFHQASHDGLMAVLAALRLARTDDRAAIRDALEKVRIEGFFGPFACTSSDHQSAPRDPAILVTVKKGEFVPYK